MKAGPPWARSAGATDPGPTPQSPPLPGRRPAFFLPLALVAAALLELGFLVSTRDYPPATLEALTALGAERPFQYRVLLPALVRLFQWLTGSALPLKAVYGILNYLACLGLIIALGRLLSRYLPPPRAALAALAVSWPIYWNHFHLNEWFYPSDVPAMLFFTAGLILILRRRFGLYYPLFLLASLNRETSCFLIPAFGLLLLGRLPLPRLILHSAAQALIWVLVKTALTLIFHHNPGSAVAHLTLAANLALLAGLLTHSPLRSPQYQLVFAHGFLWLPIPFLWSRLPGELKRLLALVPVFYAAMAVVGNLNEPRIFLELVPVLTVASMAAVLGPKARPETERLPKG